MQPVVGGSVCEAGRLGRVGRVGHFCISLTFDRWWMGGLVPVMGWVECGCAPESRRYCSIAVCALLTTTCLCASTVQVGLAAVGVLTRHEFACR
jgi:hypothetical protein